MRLAAKAETFYLSGSAGLGAASSRTGRVSLKSFSPSDAGGESPDEARSSELDLCRDLLLFMSSEQVSINLYEHKHCHQAARVTSYL